MDECEKDHVQLDEFLVVDRLAALHSPSGRAPPPPRSAEYDRRQDIEDMRGIAVGADDGLTGECTAIRFVGQGS